MNKLLLPVILAFGFQVLSAHATQSGLYPDGVIPVDMQRLHAHVKKLSGIDPPRSFLDPESLEQSARYIYSRLEAYGGRVREQTFKVEGMGYRNIIASFGPEEAERIIVGAHYDVCNRQPGADDNASGVAGLLEIARLLGEGKPELKKRIDLVAYTLEEPPFFGTGNMGSAIHAKSLAEADVEVEAMISLEMIGYFTDEEDSQKFPFFLLRPFYPDRGNFIAVVGNIKSYFLARKIKTLMASGSAMDVRSLSAPTLVRGIAFSDHMNYWKHGYRAVMVTDTAFFRNPNYHRVTDTMDTLDFDRMSEVLKGLYHAIINL